MNGDGMVISARNGFEQGLAMFYLGLALVISPN